MTNYQAHALLNQQKLGGGRKRLSLSLIEEAYDL